MINLSGNKKKSGFTLIELIMVIAILAIFAVIALPRFSGYSEAAKISADRQMADVVANAGTVYCAANNGAIPTMAQLVSGNYIEKAYTTSDLKSTLYKAGTPVFTIVGASFPALLTVTIGGTNRYSVTK